MKRPLFWSVFAFALGEVTCLYSERIVKISIIFIMLIFCARIYKFKFGKNIFVFPIMYILGIMVVFGYNLANTESSGWSLVETNEKYNVYNYAPVEKKEYRYKGKGIVVDYSINENTYTYYVENLNSVINDKNITDGFRFLIYMQEKKFDIGDVLVIDGKINSFANATNPGNFSQEKYYGIRNVYYCMNEKDASIMDTDDFDVAGFQKLFYKIKKILNDLRVKINNRLYMIADMETASMYSGMLLGDKKSIDTYTKQLFRINGIIHILTISGLHISLLGGFVYWSLRKMKMPLPLACVLSVVIVVAYGIMVGSAFPTIRAVIMLSHKMLGDILGRNTDILTSMALAFAFMLVGNPLLLLDSGFLLSYAALFGIVLSGYIIKNIKIEKKYVLRKYLISSLVVSMSINLITFPISVNIYYEYSVISPILNIIIVPFSSIAIICGIVGLIISCLSVSLAIVVVKLGTAIFLMFYKVCESLSLIPWCSINVGHISFVQIIIYYVCILGIILILNKSFDRKMRNIIHEYICVWTNKRQIGIIKMFGVILVIGFSILVMHIFDENIGEKVVFLDVGQGNCILIETIDNIGIVVDGGSVSKNEIGEYTIVPSLKYFRKATVDFWLVTHLDSDHVNGLEYILENNISGIKVKNILLAESIKNDEKTIQFLEKVREYNKRGKHEIKVVWIKAGDKIATDKFEVKIMHPHINYHTDDANDKSIVFLYVGEQVSAFITGDIGNEGEKYMFENINNKNVHDDILECDVIQVPHHGSKYSVNQDFYLNIRGKYAVISCGVNNSYGHPHKETMKILNEFDYSILRTDQNGAIIFNAR